MAPPYRNVVGLTEVEEEDIRELIVPQEENIEEMLEEFDEEEQQQPAEEEENPGEPSTASLRTALEMFDKLTHYLYNMDPNNARAYAAYAALHRDMRGYEDMLNERVNRMIQPKITDFFRVGQQQEQQEEGGGDSDVQSDDNLEDVLSLFSGFQDDDWEDPEASPTPSPQPSTSAAEPSSPL